MFETSKEPNFDPSIMPLYSRWQMENQHAGVWTYLYVRADHDLAAAFSALFWPQFVEVEGHVFLREQYVPERFEQWKREMPDRRTLESLVNHVHIAALFKDVDTSGQGLLHEGVGDVDLVPLYEYLASVLMIFWRRALEAEFPGRQFEFYSENPEGIDPTITFYQKEQSKS